MSTFPSSAPSPCGAGEVSYPLRGQVRTTDYSFFMCVESLSYLAELTGQDVGLMPPLFYCLGTCLWHLFHSFVAKEACLVLWLSKPVFLFLFFFLQTCFFCAHLCPRLCSVAQSYLTLCDPICSPPGSSVHAIVQARVLVWVAISFSRGSSQPRDQTCVSCIGRWILYC